METNIFTMYMSFIITVTAILMYLLPSIVAYERRHQQKLAIFVLNLFLGWSFIGWIVCLVWACTEVRRRGPPPIYHM